MINKLIITMPAILIVFYGSVHSAEEGGGEETIKCKNFPEAIREAFNKIPPPTLNHLRNGSEQESLSIVSAPYKCTLTRSAAYNRTVGVHCTIESLKLENSQQIARAMKKNYFVNSLKLRLDWDPNKGAHFNLHMAKEVGRDEKYAFKFPGMKQRQFKSIATFLNKCQNPRDVIAALSGFGDHMTKHSDDRQKRNNSNDYFTAFIKQAATAENPENAPENNDEVREEGESPSE